MLRTIEKPVIYFAGPEVFNTNRDDQAMAEAWGEKHGFKILHPTRHSYLKLPKLIYPKCVDDARSCDVIVADVNDFRGKCMDDGTAIEIGKGHGAVILGYKDKKEHPVERFSNFTKKGDIFVDDKGYFIEDDDRNLMVTQSLNQPTFYGPRAQALEKIARYINNNVKGWYRHEDPLLGRKLLPPNAEEVFETITPNLEVDVTRFKAIIEHPMMRRHREVKQLGALYWTYPDATHSRYAHFLMTFKFTYDMLRHLRLSEEEKRHTLAYALLHDIGHTPYSHELEEIAKLDQMEAAKKIITEKSFRKALAECDIDLETLLGFFEKKNSLRAIVSDKVLGTEKLAYLFRDGIATGKGGYDNIERIIQHTIFEDGKLGIDEQGAESALKQIQLYYTTYASTYFSPATRLSQRVFTLLGQIGIDSGALPKNWQTLNDVWYDYFNIKAEQSGNKELRKLGGDGIVKQNYVCVGSLRLPGAEKLEESVAHVGNITEREYTRFLTKIPVRKRKALEEKLCKKAGVEPLDILVAHGGRLSKLSIDDTFVFRKRGEPVRLLADMRPHIKKALEKEAKLNAVSIRFYVRKECAEQVSKKIPELIETFKKLIPA